MTSLDVDGGGGEKSKVPEARLVELIVVEGDRNEDTDKEARRGAEPPELEKDGSDDNEEEEEEEDMVVLDMVVSFKSEARALLALAIPVSITRVLVGVSRMTSLLFVGRLTSASSLAAASLAGSVSNVTGYSIMVSFIGGLSTMAGQAFGAKNYEAVGYHFQCALLMTYTAALFPVTVLWLFSKPVLVLLGQNDTVSSEAATYLHILIPSVFAFGSRQCIQTWCQAQRIVRPFTVNALLVAVASFPVTWALVRAMDYKGGALATTATTTFQFALDLGYVLFSGVY